MTQYSNLDAPRYRKPRFIDLDAPKPKRRSRRKRLIIWLAILLILGGGLFAFYRTPFVQSILAPISFFARLAQPVKLTEVDGRVNALILGLDSRTDSFQGLTDTILVGSVSVAEGQPALISIPRDFWVTLPCGNNKINVAYNCGGGAYQANTRFDQEKAANFAKTKIEGILGIKIPYWVVVDFEGFKEIINTLEGVKVCVERTFDDYSYPVPGRENAHPLSSRYEHLHFEAGCQVMSGETALKYARSRNGTNGEGSDFARALRQQKVILGVKDKILSLNLLLNPGKLSKLYQDITNAVRTNASFGEIRKALEIAGKLGDLSQVKSLVVDPASGLVYHPANSAPYGGAYVLIPKVGNYSKIQAAVRKLLFGSETGEKSGGKP
ncbi:hypothetical protein A2V54_03340 [candidate division WWE3 bacterium RBG_19FT_COMBO_53_11]|uniref:Cell envelope-related transcriptional attenuator domain-containing protein n=1 Tax=candidate division WWE3 bacterium RBG_19FT_COMBO_53_11 TaxID=1802613 RepID=A0A1F4UJI9_UNCKA|nr:MAG: hypothetical protein A2155_02920 [candidate division WWE3 bacterium RBG_16_52_45]OGC44383.1 MAG: hypothetical protein A2V54_03340 [candidate division WWE3 bacterium RBG_19FT_COMBO_53_11]